MDPDDPRQWYWIVPLLLIAAGFAVFLAVRGAFLVLALVAAATAYSMWATWRAGRPLWPGGPRRGA